MSSDLKVTNIKHESSSSNNLVLGSDGNVSITNTLSAGTIGSAVNFATGSFTPAFVKLSTNTALFTDSSPTAEGFYQKMGKIVHITGSIQNDGSFSYGTGVGDSTDVAVGNLPFNASLQSASDDYWNQGIFHIWFSGLSGWNASYRMFGLMRTDPSSSAPTNQFALYFDSTNASATVTAQYWISANSSIIFNGFYFTDD